MPARDLKKLHKDLYSPPEKPVLVEVPPLNYLMVNGQGDPVTSDWYMSAIEALYAVAYTLKFTLKRKGAALDFVVPPLEGLWWAEDMGTFSAGERDKWLWTAMIVAPEPIDAATFQAAHEQARAKKPLPAAEQMRFECLKEGQCAQVMHLGPYAEEAPTIARLHAFIAEQGLVPRGKHHEIYLSDPRRGAPEKMKTVLRQPVTAAS